MKSKYSGVYLIAFVLLAMLLLAMLPSSCGAPDGVREGVDDTLKLPPPPPTTGALQNSIKPLNDRLTKLEASVKDSKAQIAEGALQADAAAGNLQMALPS